MGDEFTLWTDPWNTNLRAFNGKLEAECILFEAHNVEGDESTCYHDGVEYRFGSAKDRDLASDIYDEM